MARIALIISIITISSLFFRTVPVIADTMENLKKTKKNTNPNSTDHLLCEKQTRSFEIALGIPPNLLTAMSLAESGKWNKKDKSLFSWPWTITADGRSLYMISKQSAILKVRLLKAQGIKNIDIGCMQVNLFYHPKAFENLSVAFDPERNVGYAANFLAALNQSTLSWTQAAANYHSTSMRKNQAYLNKVLGLWQKISKRSIRNSGFYLSPNPAYSDPLGRSAQTALLKSRFRARLNAERNAKKSDKKKQDLDAWRRGRFDRNLYKATMALQKAKKVRVDKAYLNKGKRSFSQKRQSQLLQWRKSRSGSAFRN